MFIKKILSVIKNSQSDSEVDLMGDAKLKKFNDMLSIKVE